MARPPLPLGTWGKVTRTLVAPGRYRARAKYRDFDGHTRVVERFGKTGAAAERDLVEALRDRAAPARGDTITRDTTITTLSELWVAEIAGDGKHTPQTVEVYASALKVHVVPALGRVRLSEVSVGLVDRFLKARESAATAKRCRVVLTGMFGMAVRHDALEQNPVRDTARRTAEREPVRAMTVGEVVALRATVASWAGGNGHGPPRALDLPEIVDVMLGTGARIGEILAIREVDLALGADPPTVAITGTIVENRRQPKPKSDASWRTLVLPAFAVASIRRQLARNLPVDEDRLLFPSRTGGPRTTANVRRQWRDARGAAYAWVTPHTFRKTVATAIDRSADIESAAAQLGHAGPDVTRVHYIQRVSIGPDMREVLDQFSPVRGVGETG